MQIWVAISNSQLNSLDHGEVVLESSSWQFLNDQGQPAGDLSRIACGNHCVIRPAGGGLLSLTFAGASREQSRAFIKGNVRIESLKRGTSPSYRGLVRLENRNGKVRLSVQMSLDDYLRGVLESEMPASYHPEALKCQALAARTYALRPRVSHDKDQANVCDSYLCCQYFAGSPRSLDPRIEKAVEATAGQIITYQNEPILALFSSNAGGHTENYENCFSDPLTGAFPPPPLPYLKGVAETKGERPFAQSGEHLLRHLYKLAVAGEKPTADSWTPKFHWHLSLSADSLEAHMHHAVKKLAEDKETAPFVVSPPGQTFGRIEKLDVVSRGVSGVAIEMAIRTSRGDWTLKKELTIRKAFAGQENGGSRVARLNSARIFVEHREERHLQSVVIYGLGFGHGVGLQQTGAQGFAQAPFKMDYRAIIAHYFPGTVIKVV